MKYAPQDISQFGTILGIWAHPDDEVFSSGGLIAASLKNKQKLILITATVGAAGETSDEKIWPKNQLAEIRKKELKESLAILGNPEHHWLDCPDGELFKEDISKCTNKIMEIIKNRAIDTIITFEKTGITGHKDHIAVHHWANAIAEEIGVKNVLYATENEEFYNAFGRVLDKQFNVYFNVNKPVVVSAENADVCLVLNDELASLKLRALKAHASQTSGLMKSRFGEKAMHEMCRRECFMTKKSTKT